MLSVNGLLLQVGKSNVGKVVSKIQMSVTTAVDEVDLKKTCRICLLKHEPDKLFYLFGSNKMFQDLSIASAIFDCFNVELKQNKKLPSYVCIKCASSTLQSYTFKKCLIKCQGFLEKQKIVSKIKTEKASNKNSTVKEAQGLLYKYLTTQKTVTDQNCVKTGEDMENDMNSTDPNNLTNVALYIEKSYSKIHSSVDVEDVLVDHNYSIKTEEDSKTGDDIEFNSCNTNSSECNTNNSELQQDKKESHKQNEIAQKTIADDRWWLKALGPPYECRICGRKYGVNYRPFYMHVRAHRICKFPCSHCGQRFSRDRMVTHMRTHTNEKPYQCHQCAAQFTIESNLKRHMRCHTGEKLFVCDICGKGYTQSTSLASHKQRHQGQVRYVCAYCGKTFTSDNSHRSHLYSQHRDKGEQNEMKTYPCEICGRVFRKIMALRMHLRIHSRNKPYYCNLCGKKNERFVLYSNFQIHMYWHEVKALETAETPISCRYCDNVFDDKNALMTHIPTHMERPFPCDYCDKSFFTKLMRSNHLRQHSDERPFVCNICGKTFRYDATLKQHLITHTGEKPFKCKICTRTFAQNQQLISHTYTHTGEKRYKCPFCDKAFALNGNLTVHKRRHTGETPYVCDLCGKGFYDSSTLKKHKQGLHKINYSNKVEFTPVKIECDD